MTFPESYEGVAFDREFLSATDSEGRSVSFTKAERIVLIRLVESAGALVRRDALLDAVSGYGSDARDRNIDDLVSKLRRKLRDSARNPRFIATRYGEGYVWVAQRTRNAPRASGAFIVVGPVSGLEDCRQMKRSGQDFAMQLACKLDSLTKRSKTVVLDANCPPPEYFKEASPRFGVELAFLEVDECLDCAITLREFATRSIVGVERRTVCDGTGEKAVDSPQMERIADALLGQIWRHLSAPSAETPGSAPPPVRLHAALTELTEQQEDWSEAERRLRDRLARSPDDSTTKLLLATALHSKYILSGIGILTASDPRRADEEEIETLVMQALPDLQNNGVFALGAAKLLYFVNKAHRSLALELAEQGYRATSAFAAAGAHYGQLRMWNGDIEEAVRLFDRALSLTEKGSHFHGYLQVLKCMALSAVADHDAVAPIVTDLCRRGGRKARLHYCLFYDATREIDMSIELEQVLSAMTPERARAVLLFAHYVSARHFALPAHRINTMEKPVSRIVSRFGPGIVPAEVFPDIPFFVPAPAQPFRESQAS